MKDDQAVSSAGWREVKEGGKQTERSSLDSHGDDVDGRKVERENNKGVICKCECWHSTVGDNQKLA